MMLPTSCKKKTKNNTSLIKKLTFIYWSIRGINYRIWHFFCKSSIVVISINNITLKTIQINQLMDQKTEIVHSSTSIIWLIVQINHISLKKKPNAAHSMILIIHISISLLCKATKIFVKWLIRHPLKKKIKKEKDLKK